MKLKKLYSHPKTVVTVILLITLFFSYHLKNVSIDNDTQKFLPGNDPSRLAYQQTEKLFGSSIIITLAIESVRGNILNRESLYVIQDLTSEIKKMNTVEEVISLTNTDFISGNSEELKIEPILKSFDGSEESIRELREKLLSWDVYTNLLISEDFSSSQIIIKQVSSSEVEEREEFYLKLKELTRQKNRKQDHNIFIAGLPAVTILISQNITRDLKMLIPFVLIILLISLYLSFQRLSGIVLPMITVIISTIWTMGLMGLFKVSLSMLGTMIPVLLIAVGSAYGIHIISHYYDELRKSRLKIDDLLHREIVLLTVHRVGKPVILAGLTTIAGFGSLTISRVVPMREFGIFTAAGICSALIIALILIPSLCLLNTRRTVSRRNKFEKKKGIIEKSIHFYYNNFGKRNSLILILSALLLIVSLWGASKLIVDNAMIEYFKSSAEIRRSDIFLRKKFAGTKTIDITFHGEGIGTNPDVLKAIDELSLFLKHSYPQVKKVSSYTDAVKRINQIMHIEDQSKNGFHDEDIFEGEWEDDDFFEDDSFFEEETLTEKTSLSGNEEYREPTSITELLRAADKARSGSTHQDLSFTEFLTEMKKVTNYQGMAYYEIPTDPQKYGQNKEGLSSLLSQYFISGGTEDFIGNNDDPLRPDNLKMTLMMNTTGNIFTGELVSHLQNYIDAVFPDGVQVHFSGTALMEKSITDLLTESALKSIAVSLILVFIIVSLSFKSIIAGIISTVPLTFTVLFNYGLMGITGIKLDITTAMLGSIAIGTGIDYTIHFMSSFKYNARAAASWHNITRQVLQTSGKAIIYNALSVASGFAVLMASSFNPIIYLGILIALTMMISSAAAMTIMPAIINTLKPRFIRV